MLERLPSAEPDGMPASLARGSVWELNKKDDRIESTYIGGRYEIHFHPRDRARIETWNQASDSSDSERPGDGREDG